MSLKKKLAVAATAGAFALSEFLTPSATAQEEYTLEDIIVPLTNAKRVGGAINSNKLTSRISFSVEHNEQLGPVLIGGYGITNHNAWNGLAYIKAELEEYNDDGELIETHLLRLGPLEELEKTRAHVGSYASPIDLDKNNQYALSVELWANGIARLHASTYDIRDSRAVDTENASWTIGYPQVQLTLEGGALPMTPYFVPRE